MSQPDRANAERAIAVDTTIEPPLVANVEQMVAAAQSPSSGAPFPPSADVDLVDSGRPDTIRGRLIDIWDHRELLANMTRRDVKTRHKNSLLGAAWNLLNPLLQLAIYSVVFTFFLSSGTPRYPLKLLSGMVIYQLFSMGVTGATVSIVSNAALIKKISFPREVLPLAAVGSSFSTFLFRLTILCVGLAAFRQPPEWSMIWLLIPIVVIVLIMASGLGLLFAALNVLYRDVQHFLDLALLALFWFTPIIYAYDFVAIAIEDLFGYERIAMANPMTPLIVAFQRVMYNPTNFSIEDQANFQRMLRPTWWYVENLAISGAFALALLYCGWRVFTKIEADFAERL